MRMKYKTSDKVHLNLYNYRGYTESIIKKKN